MGIWNVILSLVATIGSTIAGLYSTDATNASNKQIAADANQTTLDVHNQDNAFNSAEAQKAREWNSVGSQLQRGRQAGVPDWMTLGQASHDVVNASASNMPGLSVPQMQNPFSAMGNVGSDVSSVIKNFAEARKAGADTDRLYAMLGLDIANAEADLQAKNLANHFEFTYGDALRSGQAKALFAQAKSLDAQADLFAKQGDLAQAEACLTKIKQITEKATAKLTGYKADIARQENETYMTQKRYEWNKLQSETDANKAEAVESYSIAEVNRETAKELRTLLPDKKQQLEFSNKLLKAEERYTWEQIKTEPEKRREIASRCAEMYAETKNIQLDNKQKQIYTDKFEEMLNNALSADRATLRQMYQDYSNPFKYFGSVLGGVGATAIGFVAGGLKPGPVKVSGFRQ